MWEGGVSALDDIRNCDMATRTPEVIRRVKRWVALRRWRLAIAHTRIGLTFQKIYKSVLAVRSLVFATRVLRVYNRSFRKLYRKQKLPRMATRIQAVGRSMGPRAALRKHTAHLKEAREAAAKEAKEAKAATAMQAAARGKADRVAFRSALKALALERAMPPAAIVIQAVQRGVVARLEASRLRAEKRAIEAERRSVAAAVAIQLLRRGFVARRELVRRRHELLMRKTPAASTLQTWWRVVLSEKLLRKFRSVVDRASEGHKALIGELSAIRAKLDDEEKAVTAAEEARAAAMPKGPPAKGAKKFELWISLKVGLPDGTPSPPSFLGSQTFQVRSAALKRSGTHFRSFFGDVANVDVNRDAEGLYTVHRSWKHFGTILEWMRDGACEMPTAYVPKSYDNRKASTEEVVEPEMERRSSYL